MRSQDLIAQIWPEKKGNKHNKGGEKSQEESQPQEKSQDNRRKEWLRGIEEDLELMGIPSTSSGRTEPELRKLIMEMEHKRLLELQKEETFQIQIASNLGELSSALIILTTEELGKIAMMSKAGKA